MVGSEAGESASKGNRARLQGSLDRQELVAYLLAVQVLDDVVCQADLLELTEGIALQGEQPTLRKEDTVSLPQTARYLQVDLSLGQKGNIPIHADAHIDSSGNRMHAHFTEI